MVSKLAIAMLVLAGSLMAQDYSGIWNGKGGQVDAKYGTVPVTAQLTLLQAGTSLQGTFKAGGLKPVAIASGSVSGTQVVFVVGAGVVTARLTQNGSQLAGTMTSGSGDVVNIVFTKQ